MRNQIIAIVNKMGTIEIIEKSISPFDLQKADELFITNVITGIQPITKYRKKEFTSEVAKEITNILNAAIN
jgi:branched-chain amino acid aminotransferase